MAEKSMRYPMWMRHPNYRPAVISDDYARHGSQSRTPLGYGAAPGRAAQFTPVLVHDEDTEAYYAAKGYEPTTAQGAQPPPPVIQPGDYVEFPKWVDGPNGPVVVKDAEEEARVLGEPPAPPEPTVDDLAAALAEAEAAAAKVEALRAKMGLLSAIITAETLVATETNSWSPDHEKRALIERLRDFGITADRRWSNRRLRAVVEAAEQAARDGVAEAAE